MPGLDWSDLRYALAIGQGGSLAAAARQLGVNHTTVLRRLDALESRLGVKSPRPVFAPRANASRGYRAGLRNRRARMRGGG
jgi:molybdenum-dependent DNA-binding transcriptional regulator ModE